MAQPMAVLEPPNFIDENKKFSDYKKDLLRWSRLTTIKPALQAEMVVYKLEGHPSKIKEKIETQIGDKIENNETGIKVLLEFLEGIYDEDDMAESYDKYVSFKTKKRNDDEPVAQFIAEWDNLYYKCKNAKCELPDIVLCFELLQAANLDQRETQLVLTGVNYKEGKEKENLLDQMKSALKKFKGRAVISGDKQQVVTKTEEETYVTKEMETVLISKGWHKPKKRRRSSSAPSTGSGVESKKYLGKKNKLGLNGRPLKCFSCKCSHEGPCSCPCVYHLADKCPSKGNSQEVFAGQKNDTAARQELGLFMSAVTPGLDFDSEISSEICLVSETIQNLCLLTKTSDPRALIDCACPSKVVGVDWLKEFLSRFDAEQREAVEIFPSKKIYKFGGGETRPSKYKVKFPCHLAQKNVTILAEVIDESLPLLIGNSSLKAAKAVLNIAEKTARLMGELVPMKEENSGHFSLLIEPPKGSDEEVCLMIRNTEDLTEKNVWKLHNYWRHISGDKLGKLIKNAGRMNEQVRLFLGKLDNCESCKLHRNRRPRPKIAFPRATRFNQLVTLDLKDYGSGSHRYILYAVDSFSRLTVAGFIPNKEAKTVAEALLRL